LIASLLVVCLCAVSALNASVTASVNSGNVSLTVKCDGASNSSWVAVYLGNGRRKDLTAADIKSNLVNTSFNVSNQVIYGSEVANDTIFNYTIAAEYFRNSGENYTAVGYCVDSTNNVTSNASYVRWTQPDNNGRNVWFSVVYGPSPADGKTPLNQTQILQIQANQSKALATTLGLEVDQIVDANSSVVNNSDNTTTISSYILRLYGKANDTTISTLNSNFTNKTKVAEEIQSNLNQTLGANYTVTNVSMTVLPLPSLWANSPVQTNSSLTLTLSSTVNGRYYLVGTADQTYNPYYLSKDDLRRFVNENGDPFTLNSSNSISSATPLNVTFANLPAGTKFTFYAIVEDNLPKPSVFNVTETSSNFTVFSVATNASSSNTTNVTSYNASTSVSVSGGNVTINVTCSLESTEVIFGAQLDGHDASFKSEMIEYQLGNNDLIQVDSGKNVFGRTTGLGLTFSGTIPATYFQNSGFYYKYIAYCRNTTGNYSDPARNMWLQPDNNGKTYRIDLTYNTTVTNLSKAGLDQAGILAKLVSSIPSSLFVTVEGKTPSVTVNSTARALADDNTTTISTYVYRNLLAASDVNSGLLNSAFPNATYAQQQINSALKANNISLTVSGWNLVALNVPTVTLASGNQTNSNNKVAVNVLSNVNGSYYACITSWTNITVDQLNPSSLKNCLTGQSDTFGKSSSGNVSAGSNTTALFEGLQSNTNYTVFATVVDNLPLPTYSNLQVFRVKTSGGSYGERLVGFAAMVIVLLAVLFN
jgi:hypothetical protein